MDQPKSITVAVSEEMAERLDAAVDSGEYATTGEVVREALRDWADQQERRERAARELRTMLEQAARGPSRDGEEVIAELRAKYRVSH